MNFTKTGNISKVTRMTGNRDNILGISFEEEDLIKNKVEIIEWDFPNVKKNNTRTLQEEVLKQVISDLTSINQVFGTNYKLSKIYYVPSEDRSLFIYRTLIKKLITHYFEGIKFLNPV